MLWSVPLLAVLLLFGRNIAGWAFLEFGGAWRIVEVLIFTAVAICIVNIALVLVEMARLLWMNSRMPSHGNK